MEEEEEKGEEREEEGEEREEEEGEEKEEKGEEEEGGEESRGMKTFADSLKNDSPKFAGCYEKIFFIFSISIIVFLSSSGRVKETN